jgi:tetratricopeptide (TPR) repeat protein
MRNGLIALAAAAAFSAASCAGPWSRFERWGDRDREDLLAIVEKAEPDSRFAAARMVCADFLKANQLPEAIDFLTTFSERYPDDPYASWFLLTVGMCYEELGSPQIAASYYDRIVKSLPDLAVDGRSVHLQCLERLVRIDTSPEARIGYLNQLIESFPADTNLSAMLFRLGKEYERVGEWRSALKAYARFLPYAGAEIPEYPDAFAYARQMIDFDSGVKSWAFESLSTLVARVRDAVEDRDLDAIERYRSKIGFFVLSWRQVDTGIPPRSEFRIEDFFPEIQVGAQNVPTIKFASGIDPSSNSTEAYLRTEGWEGPERVWYFYFRKINFPADMDVHGRWEWIGIYMGEKK